MVEESGGAEKPASAVPSSSIGALGAFLVLQEADSATSEEAAKKARKRAAGLLDHLDKIRMGLLTGELSKASIQELSRTLSAHREAVIDPKLSEILDEIDLRAQVELAKLDI